MSGHSEQTDAAVDLHRLAHDLRLTDMQRRFVEALAADPQRNARRAAIGAGASETSALVRASRWLKLAKVKSYFEAVVAAAVPVTLGETSGRVLTLSEMLANLTAQARGEMPTQVRRRRLPVAGGGSGTRVTETYDMFQACCSMLDRYQAAGFVGHVAGAPGYEATREVLLLLSGMADGLIPGCVTRRFVERAPATKPGPRPPVPSCDSPVMDTEVFLILAATLRILEYYEEAEPAPSTGTFILNPSDPVPEQRRQIKEHVLRMLSSGGDNHSGPAS